MTLLLQVAGSTGVVLLDSTLQLGLTSRGPTVGVVSRTHSWAPQLCQRLAGCWSSSHSAGWEQVPGAGGVRPAAAERVLFVKLARKVPGKPTVRKRREAESLGMFGPFLRLQTLPAASFTGRPVQRVELTVCLGRGPGTQGSCSDLAPWGALG